MILFQKLLLCLGAFLAVSVGVLFYAHNSHFTAVDGRVLSSESAARQNADGASAWRLVAGVEFDWDGESRQVESGGNYEASSEDPIVELTRNEYRAGAPVTLWLRDGHPDSARLKSPMRPVWIPLAIAGLFILLLIAYFTASMMIVRRSLAQHALSTVVTVISLALGGGLVMSVFTLSEQSEKAFTGGEFGFDGVVGARGSQLQLVLNTVFHLETSPGNIPWSIYQSLKDNRRLVELAVPYAVGDNFRGYRIVGTTTEIFTHFQYTKGQSFEFFAGGRAFDEARKEAVIGSTVASTTGLRVGDTFNPYHGAVYDEKAKHDDEYVVCGITRPTNSPSDRVIWIPIEGVFRMEGHKLAGSGEIYIPDAAAQIPDEHKEVSAVMLKFRPGNAGFQMSQMINGQGNQATLAWPIATVMAGFFNKMGWINRILEYVAYLVVAVAAASILASIYNTMNERRREFAILRALGAERGTVFSVIVLEATSIAFLGALLAYAVYLGILFVAAWFVRKETGVVLDPTQYHPALWITPLGMLAVGALAGMLPAFKAYSTDVASNLVPAS